MFTILPKNPGENNRDYSYRVIKEAIMSLQLYPGQPISEIELAEALKISRTPIREVMTKLKEEHLVDVIPQVGSYVSKINKKLIEEAVFLRITLEREILKLSCESFPKEHLFELKKNLALQEKLIGQKEKAREFHKLDKQFHLTIFQANNKENVWASIIRLSTHYNRMRLLYEMETSFDQAIREHEEIIRIIENQEVEKVENIVREHITDPIKNWEELYKEESPYAHYFDVENHKQMLL